MNEQEEQDFQNKALFGYGINVFGKTSRDLAKGLLNLLSNLLFQVYPMGLVGSVAILFAHNTQSNLFALAVIVLLLIIGVAAVTKQITANRQVHIHRLQGRYIHKCPRMDQILDRFPMCGGNHLQAETVEKPPFASDFASILLSFDQRRTLDTNLITDCNRKGVNHVLTFQIQVFEGASQIVKQTFQPTCQAYLSSLPVKPTCQAVQTAIQTRFVSHSNPLFIAHIPLGSGLVTIKKAGCYQSCYQSRSQHHRIRTAVGSEQR